MIDRSLLNPPQVMAADGVAPIHLNPTPGRVYLPGLDAEVDDPDDDHSMAVGRSQALLRAA